MVALSIEKIDNLRNRETIESETFTMDFNEIIWIFRKYVLDSINFSQIKSSGFAFQIEMLCYLKKMGFKGIEIPTTFVNREKGRSKMGLTEAIQFLNTCLVLLMKRIRS